MRQSVGWSAALLLTILITQTCKA
eukprot:gene26456-biopygen16535